MKLFTACVVAVLLWAGTEALAQGKGQGKSEQGSVKDNAAKLNKPQAGSEAVGGVAGKQAGKDAKGAAEGMASDAAKQADVHGKKAEKSYGDAMEKGKGKAGQQQLQSMQKQMQHDQAKHLERQARLARIRELAVKKGDTEMVARVDKLIQKQQDVYNRKMQHMQGQKRATPQPSEVGKETVTPPAAPSTSSNPPSTPEANKPAPAPTGNVPGSARAGAVDAVRNLRTEQSDEVMPGDRTACTAGMENQRWEI